MGWFRRVFGRSPKGNQPPWVSPRFLSFISGLATIGVGLFLWTGSQEPPSGLGEDPAATGRQREYVGFDVEEIATPPIGLPTCYPDCSVDARLAQWKEDRPHIHIVQIEPVYERGLLTGYWVDYVPKVTE